MRTTTKTTKSKARPAETDNKPHKGGRDTKGQETIEGGLAKRAVASLHSEGTTLAGADQILEADVYNFIDTHVPMLNYVMGIPGIPEGRLSTFMGKEGSAKSSVALEILIETQRRGGVAILIDAERSFSRDRATRMGMNCEDLVVSYPSCLEAAFGGVIEDKKIIEPGVIERMIEITRSLDANVPITIVVDSLTALIPRAKLAEDGSLKPGQVAAYMSAEFPKLIPKLARARATLIIINQLRNHLDLQTTMRRPERRKVMGDRWSMVAEQALIYYSSLMLHFTATGITGDKDDPTGISVRVTIAKEKVGPGENKQCEFDVLKATGVDTWASKLDVLLAIHAITESGGWLKYGERSFRRSEWPHALAQHLEELDALVTAAPSLWQSGGMVAGDSDAEDE